MQSTVAPAPAAADIRADIRHVIGSIPYRMALAGGWIDQPFLSQHNPTPPGSMVVVALEPEFRFMDRYGLGTNAPRRTAHGATGCDRPPADLVRGSTMRRTRAGRAVRLAGHNWPHLSGHQPTGLRQLGEQLLPGTSRTAATPGGCVGGAGRSPRARLPRPQANPLGIRTSTPSGSGWAGRAGTATRPSCSVTSLRWASHSTSVCAAGRRSCRTWSATRR